ncbi:MAG TPA: winged helix-turn-helix domain-containing protein [Actinocrinis sp.]|nr:winged helix-turn-helix domain-containing protein [Actinocrinis sp.]
MAMKETRTSLTDPRAVEALTHELRLKLLEQLMAEGPATASQCARAVGDTPSNCSYHLRVLAKYGWVAPDESDDGRERPWRALITGFSVGPTPYDPDGPLSRAAAQFADLSTRIEELELRQAIARFPQTPPAWREASLQNAYTLRLTAPELVELTSQLDALIRPYLSATREDAPADAEQVRLGFHAFLRGPRP